MKKWMLALLLSLASIASADHYYIPHQIHVMSARAIDGSSVEIEDGSLFTVARGHEYLLLNWGSNDPITVIRNNSVFPSTKYNLVNKRTGESVNVHLKLGPLVNNPYTKRIIGMDYYHGEILLEDGNGYRSSWLVDETDIYLIRDFLINEAVIIGENSGWGCWFSHSDSILINVEKNRSVRAREY
ncbi:MAG: hypothetical protein KBC64_01315 [Simkaniaceae bacterium]|nr:hypothetical protein [Simkaniaceae bacterium]